MLLNFTRFFLILLTLALSAAASADVLDDARQANVQARAQALEALVESCAQAVADETDSDTRLALLQQFEPLRNLGVVPDHPGFANAVRRYNAACVAADTELIQVVETAYERATEALDLDDAELLKSELDAIRARIDATQPLPRGVQRVMDRLREHETRYLERATAEEARMIEAVEDVVRSLAQSEDLQTAREVKAQLDAYLQDGATMRHSSLSAIAERYNVALDREAQALIRQYQSTIEQLQRLDRPVEKGQVQDRFASLPAFVPLSALLPQPPALYYAFDRGVQAETEDRIAVPDQMGHEQQAILFGGAELEESGFRGGALRVRGEAQFARVEGSQRLALPPRGFTVMAFVRSSGSSRPQNIISHDDWANRGTRGFTLRLHDMQPDLTIGSSGWRSVSAPEPLVNNQWVHLAASFNGSVLRLYVDGALVSQHEYRGSMERSSYHLQFGNCEFSSNRQLNGSIDEVMLFDDVLSDEEVRRTHQLLVYPVDEPPASGTSAISPRLPRFNGRTQ